MTGQEQPPTFHVVNYGTHGKAIGQQINIGRQERTLRGKDLSGVRAVAFRFPDIAITITCLLGDGEGFSFAHELMELLRSAGWAVEGVNQAIFSAPMEGVVLRSTGSVPEPWLEPLGNALVGIGIRASGALGSEANDIVIGRLL